MRAGTARGVTADPVDLNAFRGFDQVRRGKQAGANARRAQARLDHGAGGAFPVGSRHMHHTIRALRIAERVEHAANAVEPSLAVLISFPSA